MEPNIKSSSSHVQNGHDHKEGKVAKEIENVTAKFPSDLFLWSSFAIMAVSLSMKLAGKDHISLFLGQWTAPILIMGLYNKVVKVEGHDKMSK
jgi:hypothetical protein